MGFSTFARAAVLLAAAFALFAGAPAQAEWRKAESPHFIVYGDTSEGALRNYVRKIERFDAVLRLYMPPRSTITPPPLSVYLANGPTEMRKAWPTAAEGVGGFYSAGPERIFAVVTGRGGQEDTTLFHEYGHHYMFQNFAGAYPAWFVEGFAEYFATAEVNNDRIVIGMHNPGRMNSLTSSAWLPMETILGSRTSTLTRSQGPTYYAQAWAVTHYLMSTPERQAMLGRYLAAVADGENSATAFTAATGRSLREFEGDLRTYMFRIETRIPQVQMPSVEVRITTLPPSTRDLIWLDLRLARFVPEEARAANLAEAQAAAARYPGDAFAGRVVAMAALDMKQPDVAMAALDPVLAAHPDDAEALRWQAIAMMDKADALEDQGSNQRLALYVEAETALGRALALNGRDYRVYAALARNRADEPDYPNDNDLQILRVAAALAPQVEDVRFKAAQAMMQRALYEDAVVYLAPIANNPHGGEKRDGVRAMLAQARERLGQAPRDDEREDGAGPPVDDEDADAGGASAEG